MIVTGAVAEEAARATEKDVVLRLRVLATSDLHAHLFPFNYYSDCRDDAVGLAGVPR